MKMTLTGHSLNKLQSMRLNVVNRKTSTTVQRSVCAPMTAWHVVTLTKKPFSSSLIIFQLPLLQTISKSITMQSFTGDVPRISQISAELTNLSKSKSASVPMTGGGVVFAQCESHNKFPPNLLFFSKLIAGNHSCPDCSLRDSRAPPNSGLSYAK